MYVRLRKRNKLTKKCKEKNEEKKEIRKEYIIVRKEFKKDYERETN